MGESRIARLAAKSAEKQPGGVGIIPTNQRLEVTSPGRARLRNHSLFFLRTPLGVTMPVYELYPPGAA